MSMTTRAASVANAVVVAAAVIASACGGDEASEQLISDAERLVAVTPPDGWAAYVPPDLGANQFVRDVDGVPVLFAGTMREGEMRVFGVGVAWRSPASPDADDAFIAACAASAEYAARAGFADVVTATDLDRCAALPGDPELRPRFVASFADGYVATPGGNRTFGAGVLLDDDGTVSVVVSYASGVDR